MKSRAWKIAGWMALVASAGFVPARGAESAGQAVPPAQNLSATLTNLSSSGPSKDRLKQLEEELSKSLQPFSPNGSLNNILTPRYVPPPPVIINRRPTDSERPGNWPLGNPNDRSRLGQDPFKSWQKAPQKGSLEEIYNSLGNERPRPGLGTGKSETSDRPGLKPFESLDDETVKLPGGIQETARSLKDKLLGTGSLFNPGASQGSFSDLFAPKDNGLSQEQIQAHKDYMERYRQTFEMPAPWASDIQNPLSPQLGLGSTPPKAPSAALTPLSPPGVRDGFAATPSAVNSILHPTALPDMNERVLNQWNPLYAPPVVEASKPIGPFAPPMMELPRRKF